MSLLEAADLRKSYDGKPAVVDVSFSVEAGEVFGLLGPNGAGKSTTMMMIAGLLEPDGGWVRIDGRLSAHNGSRRAAGLPKPEGNGSTLPVNGKQDVRSILGVVPQDLAVYPDLTARENLKFFASLYRLRGPQLAERIDHVLKVTGLESHADAYVRTFSGGMKRRLNYGVALLHQPKLIVLDEPTVGVDPQSRSHLLRRVRELAETGVAVIYASHYMEEVQAICDRVAIMDHGRLIACDTLSGLLKRVRGELELSIAPWTPDLVQRLRGVARLEVTSADEGRISIKAEPLEEHGGLRELLAQVLEILQECGVTLRSVQTRESNLERLFLELTGRALRD